MNDPVVIVSAARTPMGGMQGDFASLTCAQLGSAAIKAALERAGTNEIRRMLIGRELFHGKA